MGTLLEKIKQHKIIAGLLVLGPIFAAIVAIYNFGKIYDSLDLPRPVFNSEYDAQNAETRELITNLRNKMREFEIEYRRRTIRLDQATLRGVENELQQLRDRDQPLPESLLEFRDILSDSLSQSQTRLRFLENTN